MKDLLCRKIRGRSFSSTIVMLLFACGFVNAGNVDQFEVEFSKFNNSGTPSSFFESKLTGTNIASVMLTMSPGSTAPPANLVQDGNEWSFEDDGTEAVIFGKYNPFGVYSFAVTFNDSTPQANETVDFGSMGSPTVVFPTTLPVISSCVFNMDGNVEMAWTPNAMSTGATGALVLIFGITDPSFLLNTHVLALTDVATTVSTSPLVPGDQYEFSVNFFSENVVGLGNAIKGVEGFEVKTIPQTITVPTLSEWGIISLALGLAVAAFLKVQKLNLHTDKC